MGTVNSTMSLVVLLTCIATLQSAGAANMKDCCLKKTVGGESYSLVKKDKEFTSLYGCPAPCIYEKVGSPGSKFCFKPGDLEVECQEMVEGECCTVVLLYCCTDYSTCILDPHITIMYCISIVLIVLHCMRGT